MRTHAQRRADRQGPRRGARLEGRRPDPAALERLDAQGRRGGVAVRDRRNLRFADGKIPTNELWMNYGYFDEARTFGNGTVTLYFARIGDPGGAAQISESIDGLFANSTFETQTQNERDWLRGRASTRSATWRSSSTASSRRRCSRC